MQPVGKGKPVAWARGASTLIELLVVIADHRICWPQILFPVFARARENARRASCQSNLKQLGLGFIQYEQDYDERFPQGFPLIMRPTPIRAALAGARKFTLCEKHAGLCLPVR